MTQTCRQKRIVSDNSPPRARRKQQQVRTVRRVKTYLSPKDASRLARMAPTKLASLARRGVLTHYRTRGNHRRYDLDELHALRRPS